MSSAKPLVADGKTELAVTIYLSFIAVVETVLAGVVGVVMAVEVRVVNVDGISSTVVAAESAVTNGDVAYVRAVVLIAAEIAVVDLMSRNAAPEQGRFCKMRLDEVIVATRWS